MFKQVILPNPLQPCVEQHLIHGFLQAVPDMVQFKTQIVGQFIPAVVQKQSQQRKRGLCFMRPRLHIFFLVADLRLKTGIVVLHAAQNPAQQPDRRTVRRADGVKQGFFAAQIRIVKKIGERLRSFLLPADQHHAYGGEKQKCGQQDHGSKGVKCLYIRDPQKQRCKCIGSKQQKQPRHILQERVGPLFHKEPPSGRSR